MTTCLNSSTQFICTINESLTLFWEINGSVPLVYGLPAPVTTPTINGAQAVLTVPGSYKFDGASVTCYYKVPSSLKVFSTHAYLRVQGMGTNNLKRFPVLIIFIPLDPLINLTASINNGIVLLSWIPSAGEQVHSFLPYGVQIRNGNGALVYNTTVRAPQLIINTPDPCDLYEATVVPLCQSTAPIAAVAAIQIPGGKFMGGGGGGRGDQKI